MYFLFRCDRRGCYNLYGHITPIQLVLSYTLFYVYNNKVNRNVNVKAVQACSAKQIIYLVVSPVCVGHNYII